MRAILGLSVCLFVCTSSLADIVTTVDLLDPSDNVSMPPVGVTCVDVFVDTVNLGGHAWTASGFRGFVTPDGLARGVSIRYSNGDDPNTARHEELVGQHTGDDRFTTFLTKPRPRDADARYTNPGAAVVGRYSPTGQIETVTADTLNVAWYASPPETITSLGRDGYVARIALNTAGLTDISAGPVLPPDVICLFESSTNEGHPGTVSANFQNPQITGTDWYVWTIPEPTTAALIGIVLLVVRRR